jgi:hypothetical protein
MQFLPCVFEKNASRPVTPRRLGAARRALAREADKVALFPELAPTMTPEARVEAFNAGFAQSSKEWRQHRAETWRRARRDLAALAPLTRLGLLRYWNQWSGPKSPEYFVTMVRQAGQGTSFWAKLTELRRLQLVGAGRLPRSLVFKPISR